MKNNPFGLTNHILAKTKFSPLFQRLILCNYCLYIVVKEFKMIVMTAYSKDTINQDR